MNATTITQRARDLGASIRLIGPFGRTHAPEGGVTETCPVGVEERPDGMVVMRPHFHSEGYGGRRATIGRGTTGTRRLDDFLDEIARDQARWRAIRGHATAHCPYPAWSFSVDALAMEMAKRDGIDLTTAARPRQREHTSERSCNPMATPVQAWDRAREASRIKAAEPDGAMQGHGRAVIADMKGARLAIRLMVPQRRDSITFLEGPAGCHVHLGQALPDTVVAAMKGRRVSEIVEGLGDTHVVTSARRKDDHIELAVKGPRVPLATAPDDVDTGWMDLKGGK